MSEIHKRNTNELKEEQKTTQTVPHVSFFYTEEHSETFEDMKEGLLKEFPMLKGNVFSHHQNYKNSVVFFSALANILLLCLVVFLTGVNNENTGFFDAYVPSYVKEFIFKNKIIVLLALGGVKLLSVAFMGNGEFSIYVDGDQIYTIESKATIPTVKDLCIILNQKYNLPYSPKSANNRIESKKEK
ncbi:hypothetical protein WA158_000212 [Blastocystis sp. Blastoise]